MKLSEQIKELIEKRAANEAAMLAIQEKACKDGKTKDAKQREEFNTLSEEIETIDEELKDLRRLEKIDSTKSVPLGDEDEEEDDEEVDVVDPPVPGINKHAKNISVVVPKKLAKGIMFARFVKCMGASKGDVQGAMGIAKSRYADSPQILQVLKALQDTGDTLESVIQKTAVAGGTTTDATWAGPLVAYNQFAGDFVEFLRPQTILGRFGTGNIPALRNVPFNIHIRGQTSGGAGYWVGQGKPKPLTKFDFNDVYLPWAKVANICVLSEELLRFSNPSADVLVRDSLAQALIERLDIDFIDPTKAAVSNVSPASITHGISATHSSGTSAEHIRADIATAMTSFINANIAPTSLVWIMPAIIALRLSLVRNAFGQREFPDITLNGGTLEGVPVLVSQYVPTDTAGATIVLLNASDVWLSDDGQVTIDASREASLQMLDNPTNASSDGTATTMVSMFQTNSVALRAERFINWQLRRAAAVAVIDQAVWSGA